jgi:PAS domain S-box-containing protein
VISGSVIREYFPFEIRGWRMRGFGQANKQIRFLSAKGDTEIQDCRFTGGRDGIYSHDISAFEFMKTVLSVLNLEDCNEDAELNQAMLSARWPHCQLTRVDTREAFVKSLQEGGFDVILSDYTMPGFGGNHALAIARELCPQVPFLFVSGTIGEDTAIEALKNGATDYVLKHRLVRLIPAVDRALREVQERAERDRAEEFMRQSEHKYRELFECLGDAAFLVEEASGKIIDTNRRAEVVLGCGRADILGRKQPQFLVLGEEQQPHGATQYERLDCQLLRPDGIVVPVEVSPTRLTLYGHRLVLLLCRSTSD